MRSPVAVLALLGALCGCPPPVVAPPAGGEGEGEGEGKGEEVDVTPLAFPRDHVIEVAIEMDAADLEALSEETRSFVDILEPGCVDQPFPSPFHEYPARATIDGELFAQVSVKKKGFLGSLSQVKPGLKIDLDDFDPEGAWHGLDKLTLNNVPQDPSYLRSCLSYSVFDAAGALAPRCSFAHVVINGEDKGVYLHVETISRGFLKRRFADGSGNLYEGTLSDFTDDWDGTFEKETNTDALDAPEVQALVNALDDDDAIFLFNVEQVLDLDQFFSFWASEVVVAHWDGYSGNQNNFFLYGDPSSGKSHFVAWGADGTLLPSVLGYQGGPQPLTVAAYGFLTRRLYNDVEGRARYHAALQRVLDEAWDEEGLLAEAARTDALIDPFLFDGERDNQEAELEATRAFIRDRRAAIAAELLLPGFDWLEPFRLPFCAAPAGFIDVSFATTFGSFPTADTTATGDGTFSGTLNGVPLPVAATVGASAGLDGNVPDGDQSLLVGVATLADARTFFYVAIVDTDDIVPGTLPVNDARVQVVLFEAVNGANENRGRAYDGTLTFSEASTTPGAPVVGSLHAELIQIGF